MQLHPAVESAVRLVVYDSIASTNDECLSRARLGEPGPLWIVARRQTAGRGRRGRSFISEPGNLYASLLLTDACTADRAAELAFVAGLALHDALSEIARPLLPRLALKWPNDLLCDGRKLAGILIEGENVPAAGLATVVGIGVNCLHHPPGMPYPATDLATAGATVSPSLLLRALSKTMLERLRQWDRGAGFAATREAWLARAYGLGQRLRVQLGNRELVGHFADLDAAGRLLLRRADGGIEVVSAGDVFPIAPWQAPPPAAPASLKPPSPGQGEPR